jgi:hypothetical protein
MAGERGAVSLADRLPAKGKRRRSPCRTEVPVLEAGDFINMKGDEVSFVHKEALRPVTFRKGGTVVIPDETEESAPSPSPAEAPVLPPGQIRTFLPAHFVFAVASRHLGWPNMADQKTL